MRDMRALGTSVGTLFIAGGIALSLTRCVGDDPTFTPAPPDSAPIVVVINAEGGTSSGNPVEDASVITGPDGGADSGGDGGCGPTSTVDNCGRCGRKCEGAAAACNDLGQCKPRTLFTDPATTGLRGLAVGADKFFLARQNAVLACTKADGCSTTPAALFDGSRYEMRRHSLKVRASNVEIAAVDIAASTPQHYLLRASEGSAAGTLPTPLGPLLFGDSSVTGAIADKDGQAFVWWAYGVYRCPAIGDCGSGLQIKSGSGPSLSPAIDGDTIVWTESSATGVWWSDLDSPAQRLADGSQAMGAIALHDGRAYWVDNLEQGGKDSKIFVMSKRPADGSAPRELVAGQRNINDIAVDASGIYFAIADADLPGSGAIAMCSSLKDVCAKPTMLAPSQLNPEYIVTDDKFVYWSNKDGEVKRVPK